MNEAIGVSGRAASGPGTEPIKIVRWQVRLAHLLQWGQILPKFLLGVGSGVRGNRVTRAHDVLVSCKNVRQSMCIEKGI